MIFWTGFMADTPTSQLDQPLPIPTGYGSGVAEPELALRKPSPFFYGLGTLGISVIDGTFAAFVYFYYVDVLGLGLSLAALLRIIYALWDAMNDPIFSYLSDNTRSRRGRRRPWLLAGVPLLALSFILVFTSPVSGTEQGLLFGYLLAITLLYETSYTLVSVNYIALFPELFRSLKERVRGGVFNRVGMIFGLVTGLAVTPYVFRFLGFQKMAIVYAAASGSLLFMATLRSREDPSYQNHRTPGPWMTFREIARGRPFWLYALTLTIFAFSVNLFPFAVPFYSTYALSAGESAITSLFAVSLLAALGSMPLWVKLFHRWGTAPVFISSMGVILAGCLGLGLAPDLAAAILAVAFFGVGWGGCQVCFDVLRAGLVDRHFRLTGQRSEAAYFSLLGMGIHLSGILQGLAMFVVGILFGYVSGDQPGPQPGTTFRFLISVFPATGLLVSILLARQFFKASAVTPDPEAIRE
jgi:glycoside/pentoside/hexuronide:cation symporter, GPH family